MSQSIYIRVKLDKNFYDTETSDFLFDIVKDGCCKRIAVSVIDADNNEIPCEANECLLSLFDSYNFQLVTPLVGKDCDGEVEEYRPESLRSRLLNLQGFFKFILDKSIVNGIEVCFTVDTDVDELGRVDIDLTDFAAGFEPMIINNQWDGLYYKFVWNK